jgi:outer membrane biosynthesis protein TonB
VSNIFDALEKYKFGLLAALLAYVVIFAYTQIGTYTAPSEPYSPFHEGPRIEIPEEEIELLPENIMLPANFDPSNIKNTARDENDKRQRSEENYSVSQYTGDGAQDATDYEKRMFEEAGGAAERAKIRKQIEERKKREREAAQSKENTNNNNSTAGTTNAAAGNVMVKFDVPNHTAHQGNDWYVRNPGYKCGKGASGTVIVRVKVDQSGNVLSAQYDPSQSSGSITSCMISEAEKYAKISRFNYSPKAAKSQSGWISYTFISQ